MLLVRSVPSCPEGCFGSECHCQLCGETGIELNGDGYCGDCLALEVINRDEYASFPSLAAFADYLHFYDRA